MYSVRTYMCAHILNTFLHVRDIKFNPSVTQSHGHIPHDKTACKHEATTREGGLILARPATLMQVVCMIRVGFARCPRWKDALHPEHGRNPNDDRSSTSAECENEHDGKMENRAWKVASQFDACECLDVSHAIANAVRYLYIVVCGSMCVFHWGVALQAKCPIISNEI